MSPERWRQIETLYRLARERRPEERSAFLDDAFTIGRGRDTEAAVSLDGRMIAFTAMEMTFNLESVDFDAETGKVLSAPRPLTSGNQIIYFMRYSPDGKSIAFQSTRGSGTHIWRLDSGSEPVQLTSDSRFEDQNPA